MKQINTMHVTVACKLMERLIHDKIVDQMTQNNLFSPYQHAYIPGKSCITQLLETLEEITDAMDQGYDVDILYIWITQRPSTKFRINVYLKNSGDTEYEGKFIHG